MGNDNASSFPLLNASLNLKEKSLKVFVPANLKNPMFLGRRKPTAKGNILYASFSQTMYLNASDDWKSLS